MSRAFLAVTVALVLATAVAAQDGEERPAWIQERLREVQAGDRPTCHAAILLLLKHDKDGDCTTPLFALLDELKSNTERTAVIIRSLGREKNLVAALPVAELLSHKAPEVRGNAAVTLEYIGSRDKKVLAALKRAAGREKDDAVANHMYRALGRCGVEDNGVRSLLLKKCGSGRSEFATYGPCIGLGYFEGDKKAARGVEKNLKKIGIPGGRRGGGQNTVKRAVLGWTLASIGEEKSGAFVREELITKLKNVKAFWVAGLQGFYEMVARRCEGREAGMEGIEQGVRGAVAIAKGGNLERYGAETRGLMDEYRKNRDGGGFTPKGDYLFGAAGDS